VFFNLFAAAEPSANVYVVHGTLCNDPSVCIATTAQKYSYEFCPRQLRFVSAEPLAATRGTSGFRGTPIEKHWVWRNKVASWDWTFKKLIWN